MKHSSILLENSLVEKILLTEMAEELPDFYPEVSVPATDKDLKNIFDFFEKKYFKKLGKVRLKFVSLAKNFNGKCHVSWADGNYKVKDLLITINSALKKDPKRLVDTMAHEMIHAWQFREAEKTGKGKWFELTWAEAFASSDKHTWGHNQHFMKWLSKINKDGFHVEVASDAPMGIELIKSYFGIAFDYGGNSSILVYTDKKPNKKALDDIVQSIAERVGSGSFGKYTIFKSNDTNILFGTRITKSGVLPKNVINIEFPSKWVNDLMKSELSKIIETEEVELENTTTNDQIPDKVIKMLTSTAKWRGDDFDTYLKTVYFNIWPEWRKVKGTELYSDNKKFKGIKIPNGLSEEIAEHIYKFWEDVSDVEIKRSYTFKSFMTTVKWMIMKKKPDENRIQRLKDEYDKYFSSRVDEKRFVDLLMKFIWSKMKAEFKKRKIDMSQADFMMVFKEKLVKGTWLAKHL